ncbi:hypothetical protein ACSRUE_05825 [Sorangium sp. KYC3313]
MRAARAKGQGCLLEAAAMILGKQDERTHARNSGLFALLTPILQQ